MENINEQMTSDTVDAELDSAWGDDSGSWEESAEAEVNQPTQQQEGAPAPETNGDQTAANQTQQALENQQAPYMIPYEYMGEKKEMAAGEAAPYIQKGLHYDTVRAERDQLRQYRTDAEPALALVKGYAQKMNMTVPQYLDYCRQQELMRGGMNEQQAAQTLQMEKRKADLDAQEARINAYNSQKANAERAEQDRQAALRRDMTSFLKAYPEVKADSIPAEVWAQVAKGTPLINAYTMHENAQLKAQLAAERQNKANQQRTPGALGGNAAAEMDEYERYWNEDD